MLLAVIHELSDLAQVIKSSVYLTKAYSDLENVGNHIYYR
ncbi:hypothetical protein OTSKATO_1513 [Orientia tsutsugamushi str. Kato PP]|nr:hypothetical protein OTSKATO_1513 [Orientia tsutsugamushi str. Kato PP]KJV54535.1 hypothetical protein OTSKARP_1075 [Orientia tsutsugamushi str. Karp]